MAQPKERKTSGAAPERIEGELSENIVKIKRCAAVVKGGRRFSFAAMVVVGDGKGKVGWGYGKANEVPPSVEKARKEGMRSMVSVTLDGKSISHVVEGRYGAAHVILLPASPGAGGIAGSATVVGWLAFVVFAVASLAQLVVGRLLDTLGPRTVFMGVAAMQIVFFSVMPGLTDWTALAVALGFMLGAFGQIPINDYMIGRMARSEMRGSIYGARYVVSFVALAAALPLIAWVHGTWGFDMLFRILAIAAAVIFLFVSMIPRKLPVPDEVPVKA